MLEELERALIRWAEANGRSPPWRRTRSIYRLAVAEILLQKTKAGDAEPVWRDLLGAYPTPNALAQARRSSIRKLVKRLGLGDQRAERLKGMAQWLAAGRVPEQAPGIGPYGAGILALVQGHRPERPPVDGNVARVISRYKHLTFKRGEARKKSEVAVAVNEMLGRARRYREKLAIAYALVDLGAAVCKPFKPSCFECPLRLSCAFPLARVPPSSTDLIVSPRARATGGGTASETRRI
jgi:A/G-specific adenine glycosylase